MPEQSKIEGVVSYDEHEAIKNEKLAEIKELSKKIATEEDDYQKYKFNSELIRTVVYYNKKYKNSQINIDDVIKAAENNLNGGRSKRKSRRTKKSRRRTKKSRRRVRM